MNTLPPPPPPPPAPPAPAPPVPQGEATHMVERQRRPRPDLGRLPAFGVVLIVVAAVLSDLALRTRISSLSSLLAVTVTAALLWYCGGQQTRRSQLFLGAAVVFAAWLPLRTSGWLANLNGWTSATLLVAAVLFGSGPPPTLSHSQIRQLFGRLFASRFGVPLIHQSASAGPGTRAVVYPIVRGLLLALIPVVVLGSILASADVVFAATITPGFDVGAGLGHAMLIALGILAVSGLVCIARTTPHATGLPFRPIGIVEGVVVLVSIALLFGLFAIVQLVGAFGGPIAS